MGEPDFESPPAAWSTAPALMPPGSVCTTQNFSLLTPAALPVTNGEGFAIVGKGRTGARLRQDTRCATCGEGFAKGDIVRIQLATDWDDAQFTHQRCDLPAPKIDPSQMRYRGFGARNDTADLPSKLKAFQGHYSADTRSAQPPAPPDASS